MKHAKVCTCTLGLALASLIAHASESPAVYVALHIEQQPVRAALKEFSAQSGVQVLLRVDNLSVEGVLTPRIYATLAVHTALDRLLQNTGLRYEFVNDRAVRVTAAATGPAVSVRPPSGLGDASPTLTSSLRPGLRNNSTPSRASTRIFSATPNGRATYAT
jgi:hypothetical protein